MQSKTIDFKGLTITVYEDGRVFVHEFTRRIADGSQRTYAGKFLKQQDNGNGYKNYHFWINKRYDHEYAHRLVAMCFLENNDNLMEVNHIDGNRSNNHVSNLEWCDRKYNVNDYVKKGRGVYGWRKIVQLDNLGNVIKTFDSIELAAKQFGCTHENISSALRGKTKTAMGFRWKYTESPARKKHYDGNIFDDKRNLKNATNV